MSMSHSLPSAFKIQGQTSGRTKTLEELIFGSDSDDSDDEEDEQPDYVLAEDLLDDSFQNPQHEKEGAESYDASLCDEDAVSLGEAEEGTLPEQSSSIQRMNWKSGQSINTIFPVELLEELFDRFITASMNTSRGEEDSSPRVVLLCVCRHWKNIIQATSSMWTAVCIPTLQSISQLFDAKILSNQSVSLNNYLSLSKALPLDIKHAKPVRAYRDAILKFARQNIFQENKKQQISAIKSRIAAHAHQMLDVLAKSNGRWRSLDILFDDNLLNRFYEHCHRQSSARTFGSNLNALTIDVKEGDNLYGPDSFAPLLKWISNLPSLNKLHLSDFNAVFPSLTKLPLSGLVDISVRRIHIPFEDCKKVLLQCCAAKTITLDGILFDCNAVPAMTSSRPGSQRVCLPALERLSLYRIHGPTNLLTYFQMPGLINLEIKEGLLPLDADNKVTALEEFFDQSQCKNLSRVTMHDDLKEEECWRLCESIDRFIQDIVEIGPEDMME